MKLSEPMQALSALTNFDQALQHIAIHHLYELNRDQCCFDDEWSKFNALRAEHATAPSETTAGALCYSYNHLLALILQRARFTELRGVLPDEAEFEVLARIATLFFDAIKPLSSIIGGFDISTDPPDEMFGSPWDERTADPREFVMITMAFNLEDDERNVYYTPENITSVIEFIDQMTLCGFERAKLLDNLKAIAPSPSDDDGEEIPLHKDVRRHYAKPN